MEYSFEHNKIIERGEYTKTIGGYYAAKSFLESRQSKLVDNIETYEDMIQVIEEANKI